MRGMYNNDSDSEVMNISYFIYARTCSYNTYTYPEKQKITYILFVSYIFRIF